LNKIDIQPFELLSEEHRLLIEKTVKENNTYLIKMSNISNEGILDVKSTACDILLEYRMANTTKILKAGNKLEQFSNRAHVSVPNRRDNKARPVNIPSSVNSHMINERKEIEEEKKRLTEEERLLKELREGEDEGHETKIRHNRMKEIIESSGGEGIFYIPDREHFILENPEWKDDVMPEIMDGKNIFDFVDKDIKERLMRLQDEEDRLIEMEENKEMDVDEDEDDDLDDELIEAHEEVMENQKKINSLHKSKSVKGSTLPRKVRDLTLTEKFMSDLRVDLKEKTDKLREISTKGRQLEKEKTKKAIVKHARLREEDIESDSEFEDDGMEVDVDEGEDYLNRKRKRMSKDDKEKKSKEEKYRLEIGQRMKDKIQKKFNRKGIVNDTDRRVNSKLPKHLNTGKRGIGTNDRR
jgi:nucleolar GTP-binding protein